MYICILECICANISPNNKQFFKDFCQENFAFKVEEKTLIYH